MQIRTLIAAAITALLIGGPVAADTYVQGYHKSDGTYVQPHHRSDPNQYRHDNYSSEGNRNPYNGNKGYKRHEYTNPPKYNKSHPYGGGGGSLYGN